MSLIARFFTGILFSASLALSANLYAGAELYTSNTFHYGRFEARMQMAVGSGVVSSMFLFFPNSTVSPNPWREIDIEVLGYNAQQFQSNMITGTSAKQTQTPIKEALPFAVNQAYHTYAIEWTPDSIAWYVDGVQYRKGTGQQVTDLQDSSEALHFNLWSSTSVSWDGAWNDSILPVHQFINWVSYSSYTPGAGLNGSNFTPQWTDNFDSLNNSMWSFANWTFGGNRVDFIPDNGVLQGGNMILNLTKDPTTGFSGTVPSDNTSAIRPVETKYHSARSTQNHLVVVNNQIFVQMTDGCKIKLSGAISGSQQTR